MPLPTEAPASIMTMVRLTGSPGAVQACVAAAGAISMVGIPMPPPPNMNAGYIAAIRVVPGMVAQAFLIVLAATFLAALLPARRAARLPVVVALRENL